MRAVPGADLLDRLAAEYVLGTMQGGARRRFATLMRRHPAVERAVLRWQERLLPLDAALPDRPPSPALWSRIEGAAFGGAAAAPAAASTTVATLQRWWQRLLGPVPAGALALGLLLGSLGPGLWRASNEAAGEGGTQLPQSYIGVLATPDGRQGLLVSSLRRGRTADLKQIAPIAVAPGQQLVLWSLDGAGRPRALATLPSAAFASIALPQPAEALFNDAVELAVSVEPAGALPAGPSTPYVYRGLCGKLWPAPRR